jgi:hypothetical protein
MRMKWAGFAKLIGNFSGNVIQKLISKFECNIPRGMCRRRGRK